MTNIIMFPGKVKENADISLTKPLQKPVRLKRSKALIKGMFRFFKIFILLGWPIIRWFVYLDLLLVFLKMVFHSTPHAGLVFALHFSVVLAGAILVTSYSTKPSVKNAAQRAR